MKLTKQRRDKCSRKVFDISKSTSHLVPTTSITCINVHNMERRIKSHNARVINSAKLETRDCNCCNKSAYPLDGQCLVSKIVYSAEVTTINDIKPKVYFGISETEFKVRFRSHQK